MLLDGCREGKRFYLLEGSGNTYQYAFRDTVLDSLEEGKCEACGRTRSRWCFSGAHRFLLEGGPKYPDRLEFTGAGVAPLLLSRRAADAFREHGITGIGETAPVQTARESGDLPEVAPDYLLARICGRIELDLPKMGLKKKKLCGSAAALNGTASGCLPCFWMHPPGTEVTSAGSTASPAMWSAPTMSWRW